MKELKIALIGGGFMGKAHSLAYALAPIGEDLGAVLRQEVLVETDGRQAETLARSLGWRTSSDDWREVVTRDDIDVVDICTPPQFHRDIALAALTAGKHVFCEKPISNNADEAVEMAEAAAAAGVVAQVGFNYRHTPAVSFAKDLLLSGRLGDPLMFRASYLQDSGFGADPDRWRARKATGGSGVSGDIGSHIIDAAELLFGDIVRVASLLRAKSSSGGWVPEPQRIADDLVDHAAAWVAEFANGAIGSFTVSCYASGYKNRYHYGFDTSGASVAFDWNDREVFRVSYVDEDPQHEGFRNIHTNVQHPDGWWRIAGLGMGYVEVATIQARHFVLAITSGTRVTPDFVDGAHVQQVVWAIQQAAASGCWTDVPARLTSAAR